MLAIGIGEPFLPVLTNRAEDGEPRLIGAIRVLHPAHEAVIEQRIQAVKDRCAHVAYRFGCLDRPASRKDGHLIEQRPLVRAEQIVTPSDRVAQRLLPRWRVARSAGQQRQWLLQTGQQRSGRKRLASRRGQLDRQWEAIQPATNRRDRSRVCRCYDKARLAGTHLFDEKHRGWRMDQVVRRQFRSRRWQPEWWDRVLALAVQV